MFAKPAAGRLLVLALVLTTLALGQTAWVQTTTKMSLSNAPNNVGATRTPAVVGINAGHRSVTDTTWLAFMQALGVNGVRLFGGGGQVSVTAPAATNNGGALQTALAFAGCNADLSPVCTGSGAGCNKCNPMARLGSTSSWIGAFGTFCSNGLFDFTTYAAKKSPPVTLTPLCIANCNCSLSMSNGAPGALAWGTSMSGAAVTNISTYTAAVSDLRSWAGHNPANAGNWVYPPPYALIDWWNNQGDQTGFSWQVTGPPSYVINATYANLGYRPMVVAHLGCGSFSFSTIDPTSPTYWAEHWELYKFTYAAAQWLYKYNITKVELHNEADLSGNNACMNPGNANTIAAATAFNTATGSSLTVYQFVNAYWADYFSVRSVATQDAYADLNSDVQSGKMACPFPGACPININIYGSAYALSLNTPASTASSAHQFGGAMLQNAYFRFPCTATTCTPNTTNWRGASKTSANFPWGTDTSFSTFQVYSYHSYGQTGDNLFSKGVGYTNASVGYSNVLGTSQAATFNWRGPNGGGATNQFMPIAVTEYAPLTGADYQEEGDSSDSYFQAARLATELLAYTRLGQESYYFKFSMMPSGSASGTPSAVTVVNKHGIHFGENLNTNSMQVGDQTAGGAAFALIAPFVTGGKQLLQCSLSDTAAKFTWPPTNTTASLGVACVLLQDGNVYRLFLVNDCNGTPARQKAGVTGDTNYCSDRQLTIPLSSLGVSASSVVSISEVSAPANYCINPNGLKDATSGGTRLCTDPAYAKYNTLYPTTKAVLGGNMNSFSSAASRSGYFGEVSTVVPLNSSIISSGLQYMLPVFGVARIDIPINAQTSTHDPVMTDVTLMAGANSDTQGGQMFNLTASISSTMVHDSTSAILMQFNSSSFSAANLALLSLTLLNPPNQGNVILQVIGVNPSSPPVWDEGLATWNTLQYLLGKPKGLVQSVGDNFVSMGPSNVANPATGTWNYLIGHISVNAADAPGSLKTLDVTKFVQMAQVAKACTINIAIVRRFRQNVQSPIDASGCTAGSAGCPAGSPIGMTMPADSLAGGAISFYSRDFPGIATAPRMAVYADKTAPVQTCNRGTLLNTTVSTTMYVTGISTGTASGRRRLLVTGAPLQAALTATAQAIATTLNIPTAGVYVSQVNFTAVIAVSLSQSSSNGQPTVPFTASQVASGFNSLASTGSYLGSYFNGSTVPGGSSTDAAMAVSSEYFTSMGMAYTPANVAALNAQQASAGNANSAGLISWRNSLPAGLMDLPSARRRKLLQNGVYTVTLTFATIGQAENFIGYVTNGTGMADLTSYMNANYGNSLVTSNVAYPPTLAAGVIVDVYAPYHSPATADAVFYNLQDSLALNTALDNLPNLLSGRRLLQASGVGDFVDLVVDNQPPVINPGWVPQGSSAPTTAPELVIVVVPSSAMSSISSRTYTQGDMIGLGVGLGLGEALLFTLVVIFLVFTLKKKPVASNNASATAETRNEQLKQATHS